MLRRWPATYIEPPGEGHCKAGGNLEAAENLRTYSSREAQYGLYTAFSALSFSSAGQLPHFSPSPGGWKALDLLPELNTLELDGSPVLKW
jgi:hypothetical protein